jgi:hypothetical protein
MLPFLMNQLFFFGVNLTIKTIKRIKPPNARTNIKTILCERISCKRFHGGEADRGIGGVDLRIFSAFTIKDGMMLRYFDAESMASP